MPTPHRLLRALLQTCALLLLWTAQVAAHAQTVNWVTWTSPGSYPSNNPSPSYNYTNGANGSLTLPNNTTVTVALTGEVIQHSCFASSASSCPVGWWRSQGGWGGASYPIGTFTSANVPSLPTNANLIAQAGYVPAVARHTLSFSQPVTNIVMTVASLGGNATMSAYKFDQDFTVLSQNTNCTRPLTDATPQQVNCLVVQGRTLSGREGAGTVQFTGTYTSISWEVTAAEFFSGFNVGVTSASFTDQNPLTLTASLYHILAGNDTSTLSTAGGSGTGAVTYTVVSGPCTVSGNTLTGTSVGTCRVTATKAGDGTYASLTSNTATVTVIKPLYVTYNGNGQTYGSPPTDSGAYDAGDTVTVLGENLQQRTGYTFNGWNTAANGSGTSYAAGGTFNIAANTTLYARWQAVAAPASSTASIPTLSEWGLVLLSLAAAALGMRAVRRRI